MKKMLSLLLMLLLLSACGAAFAQDAMDAEETGPQFPFLAETNELAVNVRAEMSTKARRVGRLERGAQLTVLSAQLNSGGEVWYAVALEDGTQGYIRSDLLVSSAALEAERATYAKPKSEDQLIGNKNSKKYHEPYCRTLPAEKNRVYFDTAEEAESKGYVHCKNCD